MSDTRLRSHPEDIVPRFLIRLTLAFLTAVMALVIIARISDRPLEATPSNAPIIAERQIMLTGDASGAARVFDTRGTLIADFPGDKGGFIAGINRVIARERAKIGADPAAPVALRLREGHRLSIYDPSTGWSAELMGFGADNLRTFARLLDPPKQ